MNYVFVRRHNPAYDFIILRHFAEQGLPATDSLTPAQARDRVKMMNQKPSLTPSELLYRDYLDEFAYFPDLRPAFYRLVDRAVGGNGEPDVGTLSRLEKDLPRDQGPLLFTAQQVAEDVADFYRRYLERPLERELTRKASSRVLARYFTKSELDRLPDIREVSKEEYYESFVKVASELLSWLREVTPEIVAEDMSRVLADHERSPAHMQKSRELEPKNRETVGWRCLHQSEYLTVSGFASNTDEQASLFLKPARGFQIPDELAEPGVSERVFPFYFVKQTML